MAEGTRPRRAKDKLTQDEPVTVDALRKIATCARPLIETLIDVSVELAALRDAATVQGIDWSQIKAVLKAQILDEADAGNRVRRLLTKADNATAYADLLGLGRQNNFSPARDHDPVTGEVYELEAENV